MESWYTYEVLAHLKKSTQRDYEVLPRMLAISKDACSIV